MPTHEYYVAHREKYIADSVNYRALHSEKRNAQSRAWRTEHPHSWRESNARWERSLPGKFNHMKKSAKRRGLLVDMTLDQYMLLLEDKTCHYCKNGLAETGSSLDRKNSNLGYSVENCVPCCTDCNMIRGKDRISHLEMIEVANLLNKLRSKP